MSMDAELYERVRKLEKQMAALLDRHPEVRAILQRDVMATATHQQLETVVEQARRTTCEVSKVARLLGSYRLAP